MAKDIYHKIVRSALEKDGWTITDDPFTLKVGGRSTFSEDLPQLMIKRNSLKILTFDIDLVEVAQWII